MPAGTTRPRKSPAERAQLDLDAAIKRRDAAQKKVDKLSEGLEPARQELRQSAALVDYLSKNPLLPGNEPEEGEEEVFDVEQAPASLDEE